MVKDNSPKAFARAATLYPTNAIQSREQDGMSLRDYFAAKAMQGFLSADTDFNLPPDVMARDAYDVADAMLKARLA